MLYRLAVLTIYNGYLPIVAEVQNGVIFRCGLQEIFISGCSKIGKGTQIFQNVTIGSVDSEGSKNHGSPLIRNNCIIGAGTVTVGGIEISDECKIGPNTVVYRNLEPNTIVVSAESIIKK